jgi:signal transduction histidine kinase
MSMWHRHKCIIEHNCSSESGTKDLAYWRNHLFSMTITYLLPFCLIALLPGIFWSAKTKAYILLVADIMAAVTMLMIAYLPGLSILCRKFAFIGCLYLLSCVLLYSIGLSGPGLLYLQMINIFSILIFPSSYRYIPAFSNTAICACVGVLIPLHALPWVSNVFISLGTWVAVSSNLVFLSFLEAALIPKLFDGLAVTLKKEKGLSLQLSNEQKVLRETMHKLEQKNSEVEQFASTASHDLQEPLRMITGFLTLLSKKYQSLFDEEGKKYIHYAIDGAQRMRKIILDLLVYSKAGHPEGVLDLLDLNEIVEEARFLYSRKIEEKQAVITSDDLPSVHMHDSAARQVFQNLISNALKYSKKNVPPRIHISVTEYREYWEFSVSDNGIGIPEESFDTIFVILKRLHGTSEYSGTGIGLAIVKKIIEYYGGRIWLVSKEGEGSVFYFTVLKQNKVIDNTDIVF